MSDVSNAKVSLSYWTREQLAAFKARLLERRKDLRADIAREIGKYDEDRATLLTDNVPDSAELAVADLVVDLDLAEIGRDIRELREVEAALKRLDADTFGACVDCGAMIEPARLERTPHVARCIGCQQRAEASRGAGPKL